MIYRRTVPIVMLPDAVEALLAGKKTTERRIDVVNGRVAVWRSLKPRDLLWVREAWHVSPDFNHLPTRDLPSGITPRYGDRGGARHRASIHMPRSASRITMEVTKVDLERLHTMGIDDAWAEGFRENPLLRFREVNGGWEANPVVVVISFRTILTNVMEAA